MAGLVKTFRHYVLRQRHEARHAYRYQAVPGGRITYKTNGEAQ